MASVGVGGAGGGGAVAAAVGCCASLSKAAAMARKCDPVSYALLADFGTKPEL